MTLPELNALSPTQLKAQLFSCCGSTAWVNELAKAFPLETNESLFEQAEISWFSLTENDWREAFTHHPKIGDVRSLREKFASTSAWATAEQASVAVASEQVLNQLAEGNRLYEARFGCIFIVCATGKSAVEMLAILQARLPNSPADELQIAMQEQLKITKIRLEKLVHS